MGICLRSHANSELGTGQNLQTLVTLVTSYPLARGPDIIVEVSKEECLSNLCKFTSVRTLPAIGRSSRSWFGPLGGRFGVVTDLNPIGLND